MFIISHDVRVAARCDTSQVQPSFLAAFPALKSDDLVNMNGMVGVNLQTLSRYQFLWFPANPAAFTISEHGTSRTAAERFLCAR